MARDSSSCAVTSRRLPRFYLLRRTSPHPAPGPARGEESLGLGELPELGAAPGGPDELCVPPPGRGGLAQRLPGARGCQGAQADARGTRARGQTLGTGPRRAWAAGQPRPVLVYQGRPAQSHAFLARNYFQEPAFGDMIGPRSERGFYSS